MAPSFHILVAERAASFCGASQLGASKCIAAPVLSWVEGTLSITSSTTKPAMPSAECPYVTASLTRAKEQPRSAWPFAAFGLAYSDPWVICSIWPLGNLRIGKARRAGIASGQHHRNR